MEITKSYTYSECLKEHGLKLYVCYGFRFREKTEYEEKPPKNFLGIIWDLRFSGTDCNFKTKSIEMHVSFSGGKLRTVKFGDEYSIECTDGKIIFNMKSLEYDYDLDEKDLDKLTLFFMKVREDYVHEIGTCQ